LKSEICCHKSAFGGVCLFENAFLQNIPKIFGGIKNFMKNKSLFGFFLLSAIVCLFSFAAAQERAEKAEKADKADKAGYKMSQKEFCSENWSNGDNFSFSEMREMTAAPTSLLSVDGQRNGGISVKGENRNDILIRACVRAWGETEEAARSAARGIRIESGSVIRAENISEDSRASVSYQILVPRQTNLKLTAHNGGISISSVEGSLEFETKNGGVSLSDVAGDVRGRTTNSGVFVKLSGAGWRGSGLNVETTNGGVNLSMPENYAARIETGTVNGGFKSDFGSLNVEKEDGENRWNRKKSVTADLNGGGAPIRVVTTNGGVKISAFR
jgi:DUF4097 and DUF4098 domain-containing protein YvlB